MHPLAIITLAVVAAMPATALVKVTGDDFMLMTPNEKRCIEAVSDDCVEFQQCTGSDEQLWRFTKRNQWKNRKTGNCLTIPDKLSYPKKNDKIMLEPCSNHSNPYQEFMDDSHLVLDATVVEGDGPCVICLGPCPTSYKGVCAVPSSSGAWWCYAGTDDKVVPKRFCDLEKGAGCWYETGVEECSSKCGVGRASVEYKCKNCAHNGYENGFCEEKTKPKKTMACVGNCCGDWSEWTTCSAKTCGLLGQQTRNCTSKEECSGPSTRECRGPCEKRGTWSDWGSCSAKECGTNGVMRRNCTAGDPGCSGPDVKGCSAPACAGTNGKWSDWGTCSASTCGTKGQQVRRCDSPAPANGGEDCEGSPFQECEAEPCKDAALSAVSTVTVEVTKTISVSQRPTLTFAAPITNIASVTRTQTGVVPIPTPSISVSVGPVSLQSQFGFTSFFTSSFGGGTTKFFTSQFQASTFFFTSQGAASTFFFTSQGPTQTFLGPTQTFLGPTQTFLGPTQTVVQTPAATGSGNGNSGQDGIVLRPAVTPTGSGNSGQDGIVLRPAVTPTGNGNSGQDGIVLRPAVTPAAKANQDAAALPKGLPTATPPVAAAAQVAENTRDERLAQLSAKQPQTPAPIDPFGGNSVPTALLAPATQVPTTPQALQTPPTPPNLQQPFRPKAIDPMAKFRQQAAVPQGREFDVSNPPSPPAASEIIPEGRQAPADSAANSTGAAGNSTGAAGNSSSAAGSSSAPAAASPTGATAGGGAANSTKTNSTKPTTKPSPPVTTTAAASSGGGLETWQIGAIAGGGLLLLCCCCCCCLGCCYYYSESESKKKKKKAAMAQANASRAAMMMQASNVQLQNEMSQNPNQYSATGGLSDGYGGPGYDSNMAMSPNTFANMSIQMNNSQMMQQQNNPMMQQQNSMSGGTRGMGMGGMGNMQNGGMGMMGGAMGGNYMEQEMAMMGYMDSPTNMGFQQGMMQAPMGGSGLTTFRCECNHLGPGETLRAVGMLPALGGGWAAQAPQLQYVGLNIYEAEVMLVPGTRVQYKICKVTMAGEVIWADMPMLHFISTPSPLRLELVRWVLPSHV